MMQVMCDVIEKLKNGSEGSKNGFWGVLADNAQTGPKRGQNDRFQPKILRRGGGPGGGGSKSLFS